MGHLSARSVRNATLALLSALALGACAQTHQPQHPAAHGCAPQGCYVPYAGRYTGPVQPPAPVQTRYDHQGAQVCCTPPPVVYVDRVKTVTVEKPVEKIVEKVVEVEKIVEVEKPVYVEVPAEPTVCCTYPTPPAPVPHHPIRK